eukprot:CAMPEP_0175954792 /NCGR_PEP_ID=MMETSP0108-20121206/32127_1 /TAXON_ID=195067 ORGANISM="Goniomonas pacifica, Strain CCMP1869" /NCGR_SAMPLE_ID=MMETSP0108 /ASSEMBLY_ACC=CAM_ASM_000204 /LENGTH=30 /DNA_ID= /DNA_START= /DNA_END= /DNA_ORIENTATION=
MANIISRSPFNSSDMCHAARPSCAIAASTT